jgi:dCMP deaminase
MRVKKREDYISWDEYFMGIALFSAQRSKDPSTQVGACIVSDDNKILSIGYNGAPTGFDDDKMNWAREGNFLETKYAYVCHAELNAILNYRGATLEGSTIYVDLFPCNECAKAVIQAGIKKVVYVSDKYADLDMTKVSKRMLKECGVELVQYKSSGRKITLDL